MLIHLLHIFDYCSLLPVGNCLHNKTIVGRHEEESTALATLGLVLLLLPLLSCFAHLVEVQHFVSIKLQNAVGSEHVVSQICLQHRVNDLVFVDEVQLTERLEHEWSEGSYLKLPLDQTVVA